MIHIKSTATLAKTFSVKREKTDDAERVVAHLKIADCLVDRDQLDELLKRVQALNMPLGERVERWQVLKKGVDEQDVMWWLKKFTDELTSVPMETETRLPVEA